VILSDDSSDDHTFAIMQELVRDYGGPHKVILNRNEKRLGVGANINNVLQFCSGDWIIASAGDDVSLPERTLRLRSHWEADGGRAGLIYSNLL
jgi:glycosyltransferase involved in cell wall biosynthesis